MPPKTKLAVVDDRDSDLTGLEASKLVSAFNRIVDRRSTAAELRGVRLQSDGSVLSLSGTDLDHFLVVDAPFSGPAFDVLVEDAGLGDAMAAFGNESPRLRAVPGDDQLVFEISGTAGTYQFEALPVDRLPGAAMGEVKAEFSLEPASLIAAFEALYKAICTEETRYYLNGICLTWKDGAIEFAATDGHRLHVYLLRPWFDDDRVPAFDQLIIHRKAVRAILDLLGRSDATTVQVRITKRFEHLVALEFIIGNWTFRTKAIDGTFPDYSRIIPQDLKGTMTGPVSDLLARVKAIWGLDPGHRASWPAKLDLKGLNISSKSAGTAHYTASISGVVDGEPPLEIAFNAAYLSDILSVSKGTGDATFHFGPDAACPAKIELSADPNFFGVLMPMRA